MFKRRDEKKKKMDYEIKLFDHGRYFLSFFFNVESKVLMAALSQTKAYRDGLITELKDEWEVDERFYKVLYPIVKKVMRKIGKNVQEDLGNFGFVTIRIEKIKFRRAGNKGDNYNVYVEVTGDYVS